MSHLTREPIDPRQLLAEVASTQAGASVLFLGTVRELTAGRRTLWLDYEAYAEMAETRLAALAAEARRRWSLTGCAVLHRLGRLELADVSVAVAVSAPHRGVAFEAAQWLIDTLKVDVPIWKQEHWADGSTEWIHPVTEAAASQRPSEGSP